MINLDDYEEINEEEAQSLDECCFWQDEKDKRTYFKKKSKDVFENNSLRIEVYEDGTELNMTFRVYDEVYCIEDDSLKILEQAIEEAKRRRENDSK